MTERKPNHLQKESSPYLLQHAFNPVDWHPWNEDALTKSRLQDRLLVISIGYSACHWCHVMERESFEDDEVAEIMNRHFISVKVDREERPDIDQTYMTAAYVTSGRGGWPLNVIALPDQRPVFAGTYFPRQEWINILRYFSDLYATRPGDLVEQAEEIMRGMKKQNRVPGLIENLAAHHDLIKEITTAWKENLDTVNGGSRGAPKFPMPSNLQSLLYLGSSVADIDVSRYVFLTLDKMATGGLYDHLGGGFCRYSVDSRWQVPHFEKMLYDNAQLISLYSAAYTAHQDPLYRKVAAETIGFVNRELKSPDGLFYASLDADSEGREGAFYTWKNQEIIKHLEENATLFMKYFGCKEGGNWENELNILRRTVPDAEFVRELTMNEQELSFLLNNCSKRLMAVRDQRPKPGKDTKIITGWNALMISALMAAGRAFGIHEWKDRAVMVASWYAGELEKSAGKLWRTYNTGPNQVPAFLDDYALLVAAFLDIYQSTFNEQWLKLAEKLCDIAVRRFTASDGDFFSLSPADENGLVMSPVEISDNVIPASNSVMAINLLTLGTILEREDFVSRSERMAGKMIMAVKQNPAFHANWARLILMLHEGPATMKISGFDPAAISTGLGQHYLPGVIMSMTGNSDPAAQNDILQIQICRGKTCFAPVHTVSEVFEILRG